MLRRELNLVDFLYYLCKKNDSSKTNQTDVLWPLPREFRREEGSGPVPFDAGQISLGNIGYYDDTVTKEWLEENIANQTEWLLNKKAS